MDRREEYDFQKDVYASLIRIANYRAFSFLSGERKSCNNDTVFFYRLLNDTARLIERAFRKGKLIAVSTEHFLDDYKRVVNDATAYLAFLHQEELNDLTDKLFDSMSNVDTRFKNVFDRYWRDNCLRSVKVLYYRYLRTNSGTPKYVGLGPEASKMMYNKIVNFVGEIKYKLNELTNPQPVAPVILAPINEVVATPAPATTLALPEDDEIRFLTYAYDKIAVHEFPESAILLSVLRSRSASEGVFFDKVLHMDIASARKEMGIGEVSAKEVVRLCAMFSNIVSHPGARNVFFNREKANHAITVVENRLKLEHIRVYHSYQKFIESCHGSMLDFYLKVAVLTDETVKFQGLNREASKTLLAIFRNLLPQIESYARGAEVMPELAFTPILIKHGLKDEQIKRIVSIYQKNNHFPIFSTLNYLIDNWADARQKEIIRLSLNTVYGKPVEDLSNVAKSLGLSRERVRQLREKCLDYVLKLPVVLKNMGIRDSYQYETQSEYDFNRIREEENVDFSNEYITACMPCIDPVLTIIGNVRKALIQPSASTSCLYLVPKDLAKFFKFDKFIEVIEDILKEKRFYPYRDDLETFLRGLIHKEISDDLFYSIVKECRQILLKGYPENIINSQLYFPANARKTIPNLIEDILREFNRPMTSEEICDELNKRYHDLEQIPAKIGSNALRNNNIIAVSRSCTYALVEWNYTEKRGGTIRDIVEEYLNSLIEPIAPLRDICDYISTFRDNVKESSVKSNLLAESTNKFSLYYKGGIMYIGYTNYKVDESYILQEKRQGRRSFKESIALLEEFVKKNERFPFSSGVSDEEIRLCRFFNVCKNNIRKGILTLEEKVEIERIESEYEQFKIRKENIRTCHAKNTDNNPTSWMEHLTSYVSYITQYETLPPDCSDETFWYDDNKALYYAGKLNPDQRTAFMTLIKIVDRMNSNINS